MKYDTLQCSLRRTLRRTTDRPKFNVCLCFVQTQSVWVSIFVDRTVNGVRY